ncbi:F0F1 ATP synthase subunit delta [uncultured Bacteroides sp.]|uniref:F0F1 ATP synthase subunit delta n=1 Tax=uncultured Bacteroides sp. TaxID=162156 RepID=UPI002AABF7F1|nr:F0F1 ATP synthase subunit delta [uncultured Bacteroides sp.]
MEVGIISMRYAKALIAYAKAHGVEKRLYKEVSMLTKKFRTHPDLRKALDNPILPVEDKLKLVCTAAVANEKEEVSEELIRFMKLVLEERREVYLQFMCLMYQDLYRKMKHIGIGKLVTAVPVDEETRARIRRTASERLHARMELETLVDPSIEGGFIFDVNGYRLDASIATQLKKVKKQFIERNKRIV